MMPTKNLNEIFDLLQDIRRTYRAENWYESAFFSESIKQVFNQFSENNLDCAVAFVMTFFNNTNIIEQRLGGLWSFCSSKYYRGAFSLYQVGLLSDQNGVENCKLFLTQDSSCIRGDILGKIHSMGFLNQEYFQRVMAHSKPILLLHATSRLLHMFDSKDSYEYLGVGGFNTIIHSLNDAKDYFDILSSHEQSDLVHQILIKMIEKGLFSGGNYKKNRKSILHYRHGLAALNAMMDELINKRSFNQLTFDILMLIYDPKQVTQFIDFDSKYPTKCHFIVCLEQLHEAGILLQSSSENRFSDLVQLKLDELYFEQKSLVDGVMLNIVSGLVQMQRVKLLSNQMRKQNLERIFSFKEILGFSVLLAHLIDSAVITTENAQNRFDEITLKYAQYFMRSENDKLWLEIPKGGIDEIKYQSMLNIADEYQNDDSYGFDGAFEIIGAYSSRLDAIHDVWKSRILSLLTQQLTSVSHHNALLMWKSPDCDLEDTSRTQLGCDKSEVHESNYVIV